MHAIRTLCTGVMIVAMMVAVGWGAYRQAGRWIRPATIALSTANVGTFILLLLAIYGPLAGVGLWERIFWATAYLWVLMAAAAIVEATVRRPAMAPVDPTLIQDKVLLSSRSSTEAAYLLAAVSDGSRARHWLVAASRPGSAHRHASVTLGFTHTGLEALDFGYRDNPSPAFVAGMKSRSAMLGDHGESAPSTWEQPWRSEPVHLMVWIEAASRAVVDAGLDGLRHLEGGDGLTFYPPQRACAGATGRRPSEELMGFRDGISQPWVRLVGAKEPSAAGRGGGVLNSFGELRPIAAGEFVLGMADESEAVAPLPYPPEVFDKGSYLVVRKLAQATDRDLDSTSQEHGRGGTPTFTELLMGRRRDGEPLEPVGPHGGLNDFVYSADPDGLHCPMGAHVRRANPRDALGFGSLLSARHRIIRRGKVFRDDQDDPWGQGLMFLAINARIEDQFEFIQRLWLNDGNRQRVGATADVIAGAVRRDLTPTVVQTTAGPEVYLSDPGLVRTRGGEYFFIPSRAGLEALTAMSASRPPNPVPGREHGGPDDRPDRRPSPTPDGHGGPPGPRNRDARTKRRGPS